MQRKFEGVLIASDIDGTLYNGQVGTIPERNKKAVAYFRENGGMFTLATGRSVPNARFLIREIPLSAPAVLANGTLVYDYENEKIIDEDRLPASGWTVAEAVMKAFPDTSIKIMAGREVFYYNVTPFCRWVQETYGIRGPERPTAPFPPETNKILFCNPVEEEADVIAFCKANWGDHPELDMVSSNDALYELLPKGANKATGVEKLIRAYHLDEDRVYVIGDYYNDEEMLRRFDHSFAPSGSPDEIKALCEKTFGPCEEGAVADLIDYLDRIY